MVELPPHLFEFYLSIGLGKFNEALRKAVVEQPQFIGHTYAGYGFIFVPGPRNKRVEFDEKVQMVLAATCVFCGRRLYSSGLVGYEHRKEHFEADHFEAFLTLLHHESTKWSAQRSE